MLTADSAIFSISRMLYSVCVCGFHFYSHKCFLMQGVIDVDKEVTKLEGKKDTLGKQLKKLQDASTVPDYQTKVPEEVRTQNSEKVSPVICSLLYILFISHTTFSFFRERERAFVCVCLPFLPASTMSHKNDICWVLIIAGESSEVTLCTKLSFKCLCSFFIFLYCCHPLLYNSIFCPIKIED